MATDMSLVGSEPRYPRPPLYGRAVIVPGGIGTAGAWARMREGMAGHRRPWVGSEPSFVKLVADEQRAVIVPGGIRTRCRAWTAARTGPWSSFLVGGLVTTSTTSMLNWRSSAVIIDNGPCWDRNLSTTACPVGRVRTVIVLGRTGTRVGRHVRDDRHPWLLFLVGLERQVVSGNPARVAGGHCPWWNWNVR